VTPFWAKKRRFLHVFEGKISVAKIGRNGDAAPQKTNTMAKSPYRGRCAGTASSAQKRSNPLVAAEHIG